MDTLCHTILLVEYQPPQLIAATLRHWLPSLVWLMANTVGCRRVAVIATQPQCWLIAVSCHSWLLGLHVCWLVIRLDYTRNSAAIPPCLHYMVPGGYTQLKVAY